jgi:hypothetical protein
MKAFLGLQPHKDIVHVSRGGRGETELSNWIFLLQAAELPTLGCFLNDEAVQTPSGYYEHLCQSYQTSQ